MDEMGLADPSKYSLNVVVDVSLSLFDSFGNLLAKRPFKGQSFLFGQVIEPIGAGVAPGAKRATATVAVKQHEELLLYGVSVAPQSTSEGLSLGAAGCVQPCSAESPRLGIVLKPLFSYAGLGYVQSGKQFKKFFQEDGTHHFIILAGEKKKQTCS